MKRRVSGRLVAECTGYVSSYIPIGALALVLDRKLYPGERPDRVILEWDDGPWEPISPKSCPNCGEKLR